MTFLRKSGSLVVVWIKSLATEAQCFFCSDSRSHRTNFATTHFMSRSCIKISDRVILGIHRSASSSHMSVANLCWLQTLHVQHSQMFCMLQAFQNMDHFQQILDRLWSICAKLFFFFFAVLIVSSPKAFWIIQIVSTKYCSSLIQNSMQIRCSTCSVILNETACSTHTHSMVSTD